MKKFTNQLATHIFKTMMVLLAILLFGIATQVAANSKTDLGKEYRVTRAENFVSVLGEIPQVLIATFNHQGEPAFCLTTVDGEVECYTHEGYDIPVNDNGSQNHIGWQTLSDDKSYCFMGYEGCPSTSFVFDLLAAGYQP